LALFPFVSFSPSRRARPDFRTLNVAARF
jgi:hypothetical protein